MKTLLAVAVVVLGVAGILSLLVPVVTCPECEGVSRAWPRPKTDAPVWIGCPRCFNRGKVTPANQFMKRQTLDPLITIRIQGLGPRSPDYRREVRPVQVEGTSYGLMLVCMVIPSTPGMSEISIYLSDALGQQLDEHHHSCSTRDGTLDLAFADPPPADGTVAYVLQTAGQSSKAVKRLAIRGGRFVILP